MGGQSLTQIVAMAGELQRELDEMGAGRPQKTRRGTSNGNSSGSAEDRRRRRVWLLETYRADVDADIHNRSTDGKLWEVPLGEGQIACRCYRCGILMTDGFRGLLTVDRIIPGADGGTYRRDNIRPACSDCNEKTGGRTRRKRRHECPDCHREDPQGKRRPRPVVPWSGIAKCATHTSRPAVIGRG